MDLDPEHGTIAGPLLARGGARAEAPGEPTAGLAGALDGLARSIEALEAVLHGKREVVRAAVACLVARGHLLIEDVPGTGKTTLARAIARAFGLAYGRVQMTADLLPADLTGFALPSLSGEFEFRPGPLFAEIVLADELNRAPPRTQSALLEAMSEGAVTVDGARHALPDPFFVVATQNPAEFEGTYPLPESQLDRFLVRLRIGYPSLESERSILRAHRASAPIDALECTSSSADLRALMAAVDAVRMHPSVEDDLLAIVRRTRESGTFLLGASPRAALDLDRYARALAVLDRRSFCTPDDVRAAAPAVLVHRLVPAERVYHDPAAPDPVEALLQSELDRIALPD